MCSLLRKKKQKTKLSLRFWELSRDYCLESCLEKEEDKDEEGDLMEFMKLLRKQG